MSLTDTQPRATTNATATHLNMRYCDGVTLTLLDVTKNARVTVYDGTDASGLILAQLAVTANAPYAVMPFKVASTSGSIYTAIVDVAAGANTTGIARAMLYTH